MNFAVQLAFRPFGNGCGINYFMYLIVFRKLYTVERYTQFCTNLRNFRLYSADCEACEITSVFDRDFSTLENLKTQNEADYATARTCQDVHCYAYSPFLILDELPPSIDHRLMGLTTTAKDQQGCGSCWSFGMTGVLENAILLDQRKNPLSFWAVNARQLDLSEQYLLRNIYGFERFCSGGDAVMGLNYIAEEAWQTLETEQNCKYDYTQQDLWRENVSVLPKIRPEDYYMPYQLFRREQLPGIGGTLLTPVIKLADASFFNQTVIMSYLARGIAVLGAMNTAVSKEAQQKLSAYNGRYPIEGVGCNRVGLANHQIIFIGYGKFKGVDVWIVKNSWGKWGNHGSFYVRRGGNEYCIENYAYIVLSKYLDPDAPAFDQESHFESAYRKLERGRWGIDFDDGTYSVLPETSTWWVWIVVGCVLGVFVIALCVGTYFGIRRRKARMRANVKFYDGYSSARL